jgi:5-methyltetrahydrofolate--homocysteine methyltransferase
VKIAPEYSQPVVHVLDASRATDVVASLLNERQKPEFDKANRNLQTRLREQHAARHRKSLVPYEEARANRTPIVWRASDVATPAFVGRRQLAALPLDEIARYIDWTFFFSAWELKGRFPAILDHPQYGPAARDLYREARALLDRILGEQLLQGRAVYGFWPANTEGDDIVLYEDPSRTRELTRFVMLRQQEPAGDGKPNRSLADFIAPRDTGVADYIGAFAVTAGIGADGLARRFEAELDDYHAIMAKALADRLAEAAAAWLHRQARHEWHPETAGTLGEEDVVAEKHRGIRPAFGYPACPDHSEKFKLFTLLDARAIGMDLTESAVMLPAASVSGLLLAHPDARYFSIGRIGRDQLESYAARKGMSETEAARWLGPVLTEETDAETVGATTLS